MLTLHQEVIHVLANKVAKPHKSGSSALMWAEWHGIPPAATGRAVYWPACLKDGTHGESLTAEALQYQSRREMIQLPQPRQTVQHPNKESCVINTLREQMSGQWITHTRTYCMWATAAVTDGGLSYSLAGGEQDDHTSSLGWTCPLHWATGIIPRYLTQCWARTHHNVTGQGGSCTQIKTEIEAPTFRAAYHTERKMQKLKGPFPLNKVVLYGHSGSIYILMRTFQSRGKLDSFFCTGSIYFY